MADPRRIRERLGFGYGAPSPAMSALEPFHAGVDPAYMPQDVVTESPWEGPREWVRSGLESLFGAVAPNERVASQAAEKVTNLSDWINPAQTGWDIGQEAGNALQGGDPTMLAMSMLPGKAADDLVPAVKAAQKGIKAYHGTPHDFEKFDISRIGTGEGAQAYGHGLYFAENEGVAKGYRDALADKSTSPEALAKRMLDQHEYNGGDKASLIHSLDTEIASGIPTDPARLQSIRDVLASGKELVPGHMYEVNINADPDAFLDWDKPLSEHSEATRQAIAAAAANFEPRGPLAKSINQNLRSGNLDLTGEQAYTGIGGLSGGPEKIAASEVLRQAGIPGIKYLDAGSRVSPLDLETARSDLKHWEKQIADYGYNSAWTPEGLETVRQKVADLEAKQAGQSRNYVVFSDEIIDIVKKYGIAGALGAGLITQQMADQLEAHQGGGQS